MSDRDLRELERQASQGDAEAEQRSRRERCRAGHCACMDAIRAARWVVTRENRTIPMSLDGQSAGAVRLPAIVRVAYELVGTEEELRKAVAAIEEAVGNV